MAFPAPQPGLVIRYSYLWLAEHKRGQEEGVKDRPCAVILNTVSKNGQNEVIVLPITHTPPGQLHPAIEIPGAVKRRLGLDDERSWVILTEANRFCWPGPDLRPAKRDEAGSIVYGLLPYRFFEEIRTSFIAVLKAQKVSAVLRSE